jgi:hypothetical protein
MNIQATTPYWYAIDNQRQGPVAGSVLIQLAKDGRLKPGDLVWCEGMPAWVEARSVGGLFEPAAEGASAPALPVTGLFPRAPLKGASFGLVLGLGVSGFLCLLLALLCILAAGHDEAALAAGIFFYAVGFLLLIGNAVAGAMVLYRAWAAIQGLPGVSAPPGRAVGFCFIPFFNIYWVFIAFGKWAKDYNAFVRSAGFPGAPLANEGLFTTFCILVVAGVVPLVNWLVMIPEMIAGLVCLHTICRATNFLKSCAEAATRA